MKAIVITGLWALTLLVSPLSALAQTGDEREELQRARMKQLELERKSLEAQLALLKEQIQGLEWRVKSGQRPGGPVTSTDDKSKGAEKKTADGDDDVDDSGTSKAVHSWKVRVESRGVQSTDDIDRQVATENQNLGSIRSQLQGARAQQAKAQKENDYWDRYYKNSSLKRTKPFSDDEMGKIRAGIAKLESRERASNVRVNTLQRERTDAANMTVVKVVEAQTGQVFSVVGRKDAAQQIDSLQVGKTYVLEGKRMGGDRILPSKVSVVE